ncbi:MAG: hypothetical protein JJ873_16110 [Maricaulis sp.]|uniref:hypothetical protein n=1 Tax=Maricaulis sp. TaxID=1486257 RepID=UPI001B07BB31|nr:hypothetical protein [Maricaulis sp.]MBO6878906.1 hypothetical protein [Maricaulis sp.]
MSFKVVPSGGLLSALVLSIICVGCAAAWNPEQASSSGGAATQDRDGESGEEERAGCERVRTTIYRPPVRPGEIGEIYHPTLRWDCPSDLNEPRKKPEAPEENPLAPPELPEGSVVLGASHATCVSRMSSGDRLEDGNPFLHGMDAAIAASEQAGLLAFTVSGSPVNELLLTDWDGDVFLTIVYPECHVKITDPAFSPNGQYLAFVATPHSYFSYGEIIVLNLETLEFSRIAEHGRSYRLPTFVSNTSLSYFRDVAPVPESIEQDSRYVTRAFHFYQLFSADLSTGAELPISSRAYLAVDNLAYIEPVQSWVFDAAVPYEVQSDSGAWSPVDLPFLERLRIMPTLAMSNGATRPLEGREFRCSDEAVSVHMVRGGAVEQIITAEYGEAGSQSLYRHEASLCGLIADQDAPLSGALYAMDDGHVIVASQLVPATPDLSRTHWDRSGAVLSFRQMISVLREGLSNNEFHPSAQEDQSSRCVLDRGRCEDE